MIQLDTHIWVWYVGRSARLRENQRRYIDANLSSGVGVNIISCWEVAKLVQLGRLQLPRPVDEWIERALRLPGFQLVNLTTRIVVEATRLPGRFHRDPADQLIVATARMHSLVLVTEDELILNYPHVLTFGPGATTNP